MKRFIVTVCLILSFNVQAKTENQQPKTKPSGAAISSAHFLATQAGHEILAKGGNAFDAAIAVSSVLSVVEPISSGIGGVVGAGLASVMWDLDKGYAAFLASAAVSLLACGIYVFGRNKS